MADVIRRNTFPNKVSQVPSNQCFQRCTTVFQFRPILVYMLPPGFLDLTDFQVFIMVGLILFLFMPEFILTVLLSLLDVVPHIMEFILGIHGLELQCAIHLLVAGAAWGTWE